MSEAKREFRPCEKRRLQLRLRGAAAGQRFYRAMRELRRAIFEQGDDERRVAKFDQHIGNGACQIAAMGEQRAMFAGPVAGDMHEIPIFQQQTFRDYRTGDFRLVERKGKREFARSLYLRREPLGKAPARRRIEAHGRIGKHTVENAAFLRRRERGRQERNIGETAQRRFAHARFSSGFRRHAVSLNCHCP